jgi:hypothetical protein
MTHIFPRLLNYGLSKEQVLIIRIGPIILFMGYFQNHINHKRKQINIYFESPLGRNEIIIDNWIEHINKISFGQKIFICNNIIPEITNSFQIMVGEYID